LAGRSLHQLQVDEILEDRGAWGQDQGHTTGLDPLQPFSDGTHVIVRVKVDDLLQGLVPLPD
jgi:hypothetical protein